MLRWHIDINDTDMLDNVIFKQGMVNCQNSRDKGPPECNSARW